MITASILLSIAAVVMDPGAWPPSIQDSPWSPPQSPPQPPPQSPPQSPPQPPPQSPPQSPPQPLKCFRPQSTYIASATGETVSTAVAGGYIIALRYGRQLPYDIKLLHTDLGNWSIAIGQIGCRTVTMFEGFHGVGKVDEKGVIDWQDPMDEWTPSMTWVEWFYSFLQQTTDIDEDNEEYEPDNLRYDDEYLEYDFGDSNSYDYSYGMWQ